MRKLQLIFIPFVLLAYQSAFAADWQTPFMWDWAVNTAHPKLSQHDADIAALQAENAALQAQVDALGAVDVAALQAQIDAMDTYIQQLQAYIEVDESTNPTQPAVRVVGANFQVVNGVDDDTINGTGNLIVGYDSEVGGPDNCTDGAYADLTACENAGYIWGANHQSGSHNLVVGQAASYSSHHGIVGGSYNVINRRNASVSGGSSNTASGFSSSVSGGQNNTASATGSSVSGGTSNIASGDSSSISGGTGNTASSLYSSVSGGQYNTASANGSGVSGGYNNSASGGWSSVSGGTGNTASGLLSSISGGVQREAAGSYDWIAGSLFEDE
jgi:hypothetical protein